MTKAPAATRAYESSTTLACGLITIPISVFSGTVSEHGIKRNMFTPEGHPVGLQPFDKDTGQPVARDLIVKKIATEYGHVYVEDHEIEQLFNLAPKTIAIKAFQPERLFYDGTYVPKTPYFVEAAKVQIGKKKVANAAGEQALTLVLAAMKAEGAIAVVEFTTRGVPKPAVLLPDGTLWVVYHEDELREQRALPEIDLPEALVQQGVGLIKALWSEQPVDTTDVRSALIQGYANDKAEAGDFAKAEEPVLELVPAAASDDLMALLSASVEAAKAA